MRHDMYSLEQDINSLCMLHVRLSLFPSTWMNAYGFLTFIVAFVEISRLIEISLMSKMFERRDILPDRFLLKRAASAAENN